MSDAPRRRVGQDQQYEQPVRPTRTAAPAGQERINLKLLRPKERQPTSLKSRWYMGFYGLQKADLMIGALAKYVRDQKIGDTVCGLHFERKIRGEYCFFLCLETDVPGELTDDVMERLDDCPLLKRKIGVFLEYKEIEKFAGGEVKLKALGQSLVYRAMRQELTDDPFRAEEPLRRAGEWAEQAERLLWYASALGQGRWSALHSACSALGVSEVGRQLARSLRVLGHMDFSADGDWWSVTSPGIIQVQQPSGATLRYSVGARTQLEAQGQCDVQWNAPSRRRVEEDELGSDVQVITEPGLQLAQVLPSISEYHHQLAVVGGVSPAHQAFARHDGLRFVKGPLKGEAGLYEVTGREGRTKTLLLSRDGQWRQGEWYGLRYLALLEGNLLLPARYNTSSWQLALPADQRPPELYERALVLCSGLMPAQRDGWWLYHTVPPAVADAVCAQLSLPLEHHDVDHGVSA